MKNEVVLHHYWRSSCSWRVRWALNYKNIAHRLEHVDLLKGEHRNPDYLKKNPSALVPMLEWKGRFFSESLALLEFLEETHPQVPLLPSDPESRAYVRELALLIISGTQPLQNLHVLNYVSSDPEKRKEHSQHFIRRGLLAYEHSLEKNGSGTFSYGSQLSFADLALIPQCYNALRNEIDLSQYPLVYGIYRRCLALESCKKAAPENYEPVSK